MNITIGVDPGQTGAIALLDPEGLIDVFDMPTVDGRVSGVLLDDLEQWSDGRFGTVVIEDVHAMPKQGVSSTFKFGRSLGVVEGFFAGCRRPIVYVPPSRWKRDLLLGADKETARARALQLWPLKSSLFGRKKDAGRAEAALIAHWWQRHGSGR